jgi:hypothetical protein
VNFVARGEGQALAQLGRNIVDLVLNWIHRWQVTSTLWHVASGKLLSS